MKTFSTPGPISIHLELGVAVIRLTASDRSDTAVDVRPTNPASEADVAAAQGTLVEYEGGHLTIKSQKGWRYYTPWGGRESIDVEIAVPEGSRFDGEAALATLHSHGRLDAFRFKTSAGEIHAEQTGPATIHTGAGNINLEHASGPAEVSTGTGQLELGRVDGPAALRNANGDTWIGAVKGALKVSAANGKIAVDRSESAVSVKSANGDILLGTVTSGEVVAETACGRVDIGVANGVPAYLELRTSHGSVRNELSASSAPDASEQAVMIRARTGYGDIAVRRSTEARLLAEST